MQSLKNNKSAQVQSMVAEFIWQDREIRFDSPLEEL